MLGYPAEVYVGRPIADFYVDRRSRHFRGHADHSKLLPAEGPSEDRNSDGAGA
ncbi:MAG: hypothetical protein ABWY13_03625 [Mesorhizobium sp.]